MFSTAVEASTWSTGVGAHAASMRRRRHRTLPAASRHEQRRPDVATAARLVAGGRRGRPASSPCAIGSTVALDASGRRSTVDRRPGQAEVVERPPRAAASCASRVEQRDDHCTDLARARRPSSGRNAPAGAPAPHGRRRSCRDDARPRRTSTVSASAARCRPTPAQPARGGPAVRLTTCDRRGAADRAGPEHPPAPRPAASAAGARPSCPSVRSCVATDGITGRRCSGVVPRQPDVADDVAQQVRRSSGDDCGPPDDRVDDDGRQGAGRPRPMAHARPVSRPDQVPGANAASSTRTPRDHRGRGEPEHRPRWAILAGAIASPASCRRRRSRPGAADARGARLGGDHDRLPAPRAHDRSPTRQITVVRRQRCAASCTACPGVDQVGAEARAATLSTRSIKTTAKAVGDRPGDLDDRPHHARGAGHPRQGARAVREGDAPRPGRPDRARGRRGLRLPRPGPGRGRGAAAAPASRSPASRRRSRAAGPSLPVKLADTRDAVAAGADEIDMVIDRGAFLSGRYLEVFDEIVAVKEACGDAHLKVILETGELVTYDNVRRASWLAMLAGGDFIKTSTGKISPAATLPVTLVMLEAVRDFRDRDRPAGRRQAGRRHPHHQGRHQVPRAGQRDRRRRLARPRLVPDRRLEPAQRPADAAHQDGDRPLLRPRLLHAGLGGSTMAGKKFEYAPAPESRAIRRPASRPTGCSSAASSSTRSTGDVQDGQPGHRGGARRGRRGRPGRRRPRRRRPPAAPTTRSWSPMPARERGKYLFRIARILQERARELAVLESLDNGKPIRESRDVDIPLVAAHFFYYAGWADKLRARRLRAQPAAARRRRPGHPVELPAADAGVEDRAGAGVRQHGRAQAGRDHAADRAAVRRDLPAGRPAAGRGQHRHRRRRDRARAGRAPRRRQGRVHRLDRGRQADRPLGGGHAARRSRSSSAARPPTSCSTTRRSTRPSRASSTASSSTRATSAAPARGCSCRRAPTTRSLDAQAPARHAARRRPAGQEHRRRRDQLRRAAGRDPELSDVGEAEGAERWSPPCELPDRGFWFPPTDLHRRLAGAPDRARGDLRAGAVGADVPHAGRGGREGEQHAVRPVRRRLDREGLAHPLDGRPAAGRRRVGQHVQPVRPDVAVRRLQGVRLRPRGRPARPGGLPRDAERGRDV